MENGLEVFVNRVLKPDNLLFLSVEYVCRGSEDGFGDGKVGDEATAGCKEGEVGKKTAECTEDGWKLKQDMCVLEVMDNLLSQSQVTFLSPTDFL